MVSREATHSGLWYSANPAELSEDIRGWLQKVEVLHAPARAIIAPHASYRFSGPCAGYAYKQIDPSLVKRVFILGPSHHKWFSSCALTKADACQTPLRNLPVDVQTNKELEATGEFEWMTMDVDEAEHSIEMHFPCLAAIMQSRHFTVVPMLVGTLTTSKAKRIGSILTKYLADPQNLFVISSDFCHWGKKFKYTYHDGSDKPIYRIIEELDQKGMDAIESADPHVFHAHLEKYKNTICGRNPILVFLHAVKELSVDRSVDLKFLKYVQSNRCTTMYDSSVSYAAASLTIE